jgi:hypothetical protein
MKWRLCLPFPVRKTLYFAGFFFILLKAPVASAADLGPRINSFSETFKIADGSSVLLQVPLPPSEGAHVSLDDSDLQPAADDYQLFRNAINKIRKIHASKLILPARIYEIHAPESLPAKEPMINLRSLKNLTVDGQGALIRFYNFRNGIQIAGSENILIENLKVEWGIPLVFPGILRKDSQKRTLLQLTDSEHYPVDSKNPPKITVIVDFDFQNRAYVRHKPAVELSFMREHDSAKKPKYLGFYENLPTYVLPGHRRFPENLPVVGMTRYASSAFFVTGKSHNVTFYKDTVYSSPSIGFMFNGAGGGLRVSSCTVERNPGNSFQLISTVADASHFGNTGGQIILENNEFNFMGDDGTNIYGTYFPVIRPVSPRAVEVSKKNYFEIGDKIRFLNPSNLETLGNSEIENVVSCERGNCLTLSFKQDIPPPVKDGTFLANLSKQSADFLVRGNTIHDNRGRGLLLETARGLVEKNTIANVSMGGIWLGSDARVFNTGPAAENVIVRENTISNTGYSQRSDFYAGIMVQSWIKQKQEPWFSTEGPNQMILIEKNKIQDMPGLGMIIGSVKGATVRENVILNSNEMPFLSTSLRGSLLVRQASGVILSGNEISGSKAQGIYIDNLNTSGITGEDLR